MKPALEKVVDPIHFGTVSGPSTVLTLINMLHEWLEATDGNGAAIRVLLFNYRKAFDPIDHGTLVAKLKQLDVPNYQLNYQLPYLLVSEGQTWQRLPVKVG